MKLAKLIGLIYERYGSVKVFCSDNGLDYSYTTRVLNCKVDARRSTMAKLVAALSIAPCEIGYYFFPECCDVSVVSGE